MKTVRQFPHRVRVIDHVWIPMPDGVRLAARVWLPDNAERAPVPAILEYIPYRLRDFTAARDAVHHHYFAGHGYAAVRVDLRGSGNSEGLMHDEYLPLEQEDALAILDWLADQPWCDGRIGMMGISWGGFNALQVAARKPVQLKAIISVCSTDDRYTDDVHYMGGCLLGDNLSWASVMFSYNASPPDPQIVGDTWRDMWQQRLEHNHPWLDTWLRHQRRDDYWRHGSICEDYSAINCPVMLVGGWADGYSNAIFRMLEHLGVPRMGLIGPWSHKYPHQGVPGPAIGFLQEALRWWDHWLKERDTGITAEPMLRMWLQDSVPPTTAYAERPGRWIAEPAWPSPHIRHHTYGLAPGRLVAASAGGQPPPVSIQSPLSVGLFAGKWCSYAAPPDLPHDQREEDGGALVFDSPPLTRALDVGGAPTVELELEANRRVALLAARLSDVAPDGRATRISYGLLNLTHRDGNAEPAPLMPNKRYRVRVQLNDMAQIFPAGHRLRLALSTSYWPLAWPPPSAVRLTVHTAASRFIIPVRPPRPEDHLLRPFGEPEGAPAPARTRLHAPRLRWLVTRDLARDRSTLKVVKDEGVWRLEAIDLTLANATTEWYSSQDQRYESLVGRTVARKLFRRGSWHVRTRTRTTLRCTATHLLLSADLDAYEGTERVFARSWDHAIRRDMV
ncbi:MAG: CocE/NonD family hydrolase [Phycisphaeraceae bacterium]